MTICLSVCVVWSGLVWSGMVCYANICHGMAWYAVVYIIAGCDRLWQGICCVCVCACVLSLLAYLFDVCTRLSNCLLLQLSHVPEMWEFPKIGDPDMAP